jgi:hypothetical protein
MKFGIIPHLSGKCGLFLAHNAPFDRKCPDGLLFGSRSKTAKGTVHMHRPSRSFTLEFSTGKPANRMYSVRNIPNTMMPLRMHWRAHRLLFVQ